MEKEICPRFYAIVSAYASRGIILGMGSANERRRYNVASSLIG